MFARWERTTLPDLSQYFHIDADDEALLAARSWRWLRAQIIALLDIPESRLSRALDT